MTLEQSESSLDLQEEADTEVILEWHVETINNKSFYVQLDFNQPALVSQRSTDLDKVLIELIDPDSFFGDEYGQTVICTKKTATLNVPILKLPAYLDK